MDRVGDGLGYWIWLVEKSSSPNPPPPPPGQEGSRGMFASHCGVDNHDILLHRPLCMDRIIVTSASGTISGGLKSS